MGEMVLPGAIWQEMVKVDGADMSVSLLSTMARLQPQTSIFNILQSAFISCFSAIFEEFNSNKKSEEDLSPWASSL